jgi:hypothetical protein
MIGRQRRERWQTAPGSKIRSLRLTAPIQQGRVADRGHRTQSKNHGNREVHDRHAPMPRADALGQLNSTALNEILIELLREQCCDGRLRLRVRIRRQSLGSRSDFFTGTGAQTTARKPQILKWNSEFHFATFWA